MVEETYIKKSCIKVKGKKNVCIGLTDINQFEYEELRKLWVILQEYNKFDNIKVKKQK